MTRAGNRLGGSILDGYCTPRAVWQGRRGVLKPKLVIRGVLCLPGMNLFWFFCCTQSWRKWDNEFQSVEPGDSGQLYFLQLEIHKVCYPSFSYSLPPIPPVPLGRTSSLLLTPTFCWELKLQAHQSMHTSAKVKDKTTCRTVMHP